ncbi:MAG: hypothetical protein HKN03_07540 [Acidimicrobiales bacterium]|nr:hypothetical protein [Acidimicrobiales bacterium]
MRKVISILSITVLIAAMSAVPAVGNSIGCGDTITSDLTLMADLGPCPDDGLKVGASGITINLNGYTISGDSVGLGGGVRIEGNFSNVVVRNGAITGFNEGVVLAGGANANHIWGLTLDSNNRGVDLAGGNFNNLIEKNVVTNHGGDGIRVDASSGNIVQKNTVVDNVFGISVSNGANNNLVSKNTVTDNRFGISVFTDADGNTVEKNVISGVSVDGGIQVERGSDNTRISKNNSSDNFTNGILVEPADGAAPVGTVLELNITNNNAGDGINVQSASATLTKNTANNNNDYGIEALPGVTDGGGNMAAGNGNPAQCLNVACS